MVCFNIFYFYINSYSVLDVGIMNCDVCKKSQGCRDYNGKEKCKDYEYQPNFLGFPIPSFIDNLLTDDKKSRSC